MRRTAHENGILGPLLERAGRRRTARRALTLAAKAAVPALAVALVLAGAWRITLAGPFFALALSAAAAPVLVAAVRVGAGALVAEDALRAAAELDRRAGLDGLLATGLEIARGGIRTQLAPVALRRTRDAAAALDGTEIPLALPAWARYLSLPGALLVAVLALPQTGARPAGRGAPARVVAADSEAPETRRAAARSGRDDARRTERRERRRAIAAYRASYEKEADRARRGALLPAAPLVARPRGAPDEGGAGRRGRRRGGERTGAGPGDAEASAPTAPTEPTLAGGAGRARSGPLDLEEAAVLRERFPQYEDLIRRYFAGG